MLQVARMIDAKRKKVVYRMLQIFGQILTQAAETWIVQQIIIAMT